MSSSVDVVRSWNPYTNYTWTNSQVKEWVNFHGPWAFYAGRQWFIEVVPFKGIPNMKYVRFTLEKPEARDE